MTIALVAIHLLSSPAAESQEKETLFLPEDQQAIDDIDVSGTRTTAEMWGVSRMIVPDSDTTYYVIDQVEAFRRLIADQLANVHLNDSDISIHYGPLRDEFVHLRVDGESPELAYFRFEGLLLGQLTEFFLAGGFSNGSGSVEYEAYQLRLVDCAGLEAAARELVAALQELTGSLGNRALSESEVITVDGAIYRVSVRLHPRTVGSFVVTNDSGRLFDAARSILGSALACRTAVEPEVRAIEF